MTIKLPGTIPGIDLSGWNIVRNYDEVAADGVRFAWVKASEGNRRDAKRSSEHVRGLEEAGIPSGVYHFARPGTGHRDAEIEAENMMRELEDLDAWGLHPALDYEVETADDFDDTAWIARFFQRVGVEGIRPVLYAGKLLRRGHIDLDRLARILGWRPLVWSARYPAIDAAPFATHHRLALEQLDRGPRVDGWSVWQWSSAWRPAWASGDIDCNAARNLEAIQWMWR